MDYRQGKKLGKYDRIVIWKRPAGRRKPYSLQEWKSLPNELELRVTRIFVKVSGFRVQQYDLVTTLTDVKVYSVEEPAQLYFRRWFVELYFRDIKTTMGMEKLRCKSPEMVRKELRMYVLAHNLMRALIQRASHYHNCELTRISFKGSMDTLRHFSNLLSHSKSSARKQQRILDQMIEIIALGEVPLRPNRSEPRVVKERPKPYPRLTVPRSIYVVPKSRKNKGKYQRKILEYAA